MVRRYDEPIDVQARPGGPDEPERPTAFVWRGRLYVVRGVLAHWYERRAWWRDTASLTLLGLRADGEGTTGASGVAGAATAQGTVAARAATSVLANAGERQVWRVEAAAGRSSPVGIYELVHDPLSDPALGPGPEPLPGPLPGAGSRSQPGSLPERMPDQRSGPPSGGWRLASIDD
jgi:hypothetical protein